MMLVRVTAMSCVFHPRPQVFFWTLVCGDGGDTVLNICQDLQIDKPPLKVLVFEESSSHIQLSLFLSHPALCFYQGMFLQFKTHLNSTFYLSMHLLRKDLQCSH